MTEVVSSAVPKGSTQALFIDTWELYRKMVENDYLFHSGAYAALGSILRDRFRHPYRFLDVGCGDAGMAVRTLKGTSVAAYHGIDISEAALDRARVNLKELDCEASFTHGNFAEQFARGVGAADVVWIGLSLHHFLHDGKLEVMSAVRRLVGDGGMLLVYENASPDGEDRDGWMVRWDAQQPSWTTYSEAEWNYVRDHVSRSDFPETDSGWRDLGKRAGFGRVTEHFRSPTDLFRLYGFQA